ncbi:TPA: LacI family transcriptional regulator [Candidatus Poribacteria bacterium]|nr:LacI family transcriptional regulator [Candidatus Poribacteria bacterium]
MRKLTIQMIADMAGVSKATVSRVINNRPSVSEKTRRKVQEIIEKYNYVPNIFAQALNLKRSQTVGLVTTEITNIVTAEIASVIERTTKEKGYTLILCLTEGNVQEEISHVRSLCERKVDGMIIIHAGSTDKKEETMHLFQLKEYGIPFVLVCDPIPGLETDYVLLDHERGAYDAVKHLLELGHRKIGYISGPKGLYTEVARFEGYKKALKDYGVKVDKRLVREGGYGLEEGYRAAIDLLSIRDRPSAIFAFNDMEAIGVLRAAKEMGIAVPKELAVVGTDDVRIAPLLEVPLTTVSFPKKVIGQTAVDLLLGQIEAKDSPRLDRGFRKVHIGHYLVIRESCGARLRSGITPP